MLFMDFLCKKCGHFYNAWTIANCGCGCGGKHEPYRGMQQGPKYVCAKCGFEYDAWTIVNSGCNCGGKHEII